MLEFITTNWIWILLIGGTVAMHLGHGGHGRHSRQGENDSDEPMAQPSGERRY